MRPVFSALRSDPSARDGVGTRLASTLRVAERHLPQTRMFDGMTCTGVRARADAHEAIRHGAVRSSGKTSPGRSGRRAIAERRSACASPRPKAPASKSSCPRRVGMRSMRAIRPAISLGIAPTHSDSLLPPYPETTIRYPTSCSWVSAPPPADWRRSRKSSRRSRATAVWRLWWSCISQPTTRACSPTCCSHLPPCPCCR